MCPDAPGRQAPERELTYTARVKRLVSSMPVAAFTCLLAAVLFVVSRDDDSSATATVNGVPGAGRERPGGPSEDEPRSLCRVPEDAEKGSADRYINGAGPLERASVRTKTGEAAAAWPTNIENRIWEYFAHRGKSNITSIISVECNATDCEIVFTGTELNPRGVGTFSDLWSDMYAEPWNVRQGSISTREIAPGVRAYVIGISNIPFEVIETESPEAEESSGPRDE